MSWLIELKRKGQEHVVKGLFAASLLLLGVIWAALPTEVWNTVSNATPKRVLWAALGLFVIIVILESAYVLNLKRKYKLKPRFGVLWDRALTPYCPVHKHIALSNWGNPSRGPHGYICPEGEHVIPLQDDEGNYLKPLDAKKRLCDPSEPIDAYEPDDVEMKILSRLARRGSDVTLESLTGYLRLHPDRIQLHLSELEEKGYIYSIWPGIAGAPTTYHLSNKGRTFLASKHVI